MPPSNGSIYKPIITVLLGVLITMVGAWAMTTNNRLDKQDLRIADTREIVVSNQEALKYLLILAKENRDVLQTTLSRLEAHMSRDQR
jgi:hypothetical protein